MFRYLVARVLAIVPTTLLLLAAVVILVRLLPGNAVDVMLQESGQGSSVQREELERRLGLDKNVFEAYIDYTADFVRGDLGNSVWTGRAVTSVISDRIGITLELGIFSLIFATVVGIFVGVVSAVRQNSLLDLGLRSFSILGLSIPNFALATLVVVMPVVWDLPWTRSLVYHPVSDGWWPHISQFFVPALVLGFFLSATLMRITRTMMLEVMRQDYIRTARAKGLGGTTVIMRHALRNSLIPVISLLGIQVAVLLSGSVVIENVFAMPGVGRALLDAVNVRDYPIVQGIALVTGLLVIFINLAVDVSYGIIDPRVKLG